MTEYVSNMGRERERERLKSNILAQETYFPKLEHNYFKKNVATGSTTSRRKMERKKNVEWSGHYLSWVKAQEPDFGRASTLVKFFHQIFFIPLNESSTSHQSTKQKITTKEGILLLQILYPLNLATYIKNSKMPSPSLFNKSLCTMVTRFFFFF